MSIENPTEEIENALHRVLDEQSEKGLRDWFAGIATDDDATEQQDIEWKMILEKTGDTPNTSNPLTRAQAK